MHQVLEGGEPMAVDGEGDAAIEGEQQAEGEQHAKGKEGEQVWHMWWATWEKLRRGFGFVVEAEAARRASYAWVVRLRADLFIFGDAASHRRLDPLAGIVLPAGVIYASPGNANDHAAFIPRQHAHHYFEIVRGVESCHDATTSAHFNDYGGEHLHSWLQANGVPFAPPMVLPYTLLRPCSEAQGQRRGREGASARPLAATTPECFRWRWIAPSWRDRPPLTTERMRELHGACVATWRDWRLRSNHTCAETEASPIAHTRWLFPRVP